MSAFFAISKKTAAKKKRKKKIIVPRLSITSRPGAGSPFPRLHKTWPEFLRRAQGPLSATDPPITHDCTQCTLYQRGRSKPVSTFH